MIVSRLVGGNQPNNLLSYITVVRYFKLIHVAFHTPPGDGFESISN